MNKYLTILPLCTALVMPMTGFAQTATPSTAETPTATTQAPAASGVEAQLSMGDDGEATSDIGKPYTKEEVGSWEIRCIKTEEEADPCQMYQLMDDGQGAPVAEFSLFRLPDGGKAQAGATVVVPLETSLPSQLSVAVDGGKERRYPFAFCNPVGCYVRMGLTEADVAAFKRGKEATITIVPALAPDQKVQLTLSLDGFTSGFDKSSVIDR